MVQCRRISRRTLIREIAFQQHKDYAQYIYIYIYVCVIVYQYHNIYNLCTNLYIYIKLYIYILTPFHLCCSTISRLQSS